MSLFRISDNKKPYLILWVLCIVGSWSLLPYLYHLGMIPSSVQSYSLFLITTGQAALIYGVICWLSYFLVPKTDLSPFQFDPIMKRIIVPGAVVGAVVGLVIRILSVTLFPSPALSVIQPPFWAGLLASVYGAVNEEVLLRLFLMTSVFFFLQKFFKLKSGNRLFFLWTANIIAALIFGLGHLPAAFKLATPSAAVVFRVLLLNGIAGICFGWLYWARGLWTAMAAHLIADLFLHVWI
ncbi:MAG: CPBP family intramembrane metalloprotease [Verrucomicrobia bacterium]|nr:CPBP family intramembrane metalloprotease [Verrucomicrobiota bacterium]